MTRDELAAAAFPERWAVYANATGDKARRARHVMRQQAEIQVKMYALIDQGASCATCVAFQKYRHGPGHVCDDKSTGGTYQLAKPTGLCTNWRAS